MKQTDVMDVLFNDGAREILYSLVHRKEPAALARDEDDIFEPTISSVFQLLSGLMKSYLPDLYEREWKLIVHALDRPWQGPYRLPSDLRDARARLIAVEDLVDSNGDISSYELSKKLAGFNDAEICAIMWEAQKCLVARSRGEEYRFPDIQFKG